MKDYMGMLVDELAGIKVRTVTSLQGWLAVNNVMDETHGSYIGCNKQYIQDRVTCPGERWT